MEELLQKYPQRPWRSIHQGFRVVAGPGDDAPVIADCTSCEAAGVIVALPLYHAVSQVAMTLAGTTPKEAMAVVQNLVASCQEMVEYVPDSPDMPGPRAMRERASAALAAAHALGIHAAG